MWHEARRQEKKIRGMMVDLRKRAERRREFYEKIKLDPTQFLRLAGRHVRINLDPAVAMVAEGPQSMQPWQGNSEIMIDRFDARSHLDHIAENTSTKQSLSASELEEERQCNYERYRILVQNDCIGVTEGQCLQQIRNDELFGADTSLEVTSETQKKKALAEKKAAIAYSYDDDGGGSEGGVPEKGKKGTKEKKEVASEAFDGLDSSDEEEIDLDIALDLEKLTNDQIQMLNSTATHFGMKAGDYFESLYNDKKEAEEIRLARLVEEEKAQFTGRRSRRERRAYKDKALVGKVNSPPSYAARKSPEYESYKRSPSRSRSRSHTPPAVTTFITSFGAESSDEEGAPRLVQGPALPPHLLPSNNTPSDSSQGRSSTKLGTSTRNGRHESRHNSCSDRSSPSRSRRSRSRSRHRSRRSPSPRYRSRDQYRRSRSRSHNQYRRSRSPRNRRYRSRSRSRNRYNRRSWSRHRSRSPVRSRYRSRSPRWSRSPRRSHSYRSGSPRRSKSPRQSRSPRRSRNRSRSPHRSRQDSFTRRSPAHKSRSRSSRSRSSRSSSSSSYSSKSSYSSRSSSRSRSGSPVIASAPPIKRYRRPSLSSNPTSSDDENDVDKRPSPTPSASTKSNSAVPPVGKRQAESKVTGRMSLQERMKRKMQMALSKNYKADKQAERQKYDKIEQDRMDREEELRFMSIQMRRREREKRHRFEEEDEERIQQVEKMREMERDRERDDTRRRRDKGSPERSRERHHSPGKRHRRSHSHSREYRHRRERSRERVAGPKLVDY